MAKIGEATKKEIVKKNFAKRKDSTLQDEADKPTKTFVEDTAEQTGMSKRSVQQSIKNANDITQEAKEKIIQSALGIIDVYSLERFYQNIMEVYRRVVRQNW